MTRSMDPALAGEIEAAYGSWIRNARECRVGDLVIDTPADGGSGEILVSRQGRAVFYSDAQYKAVMDTSGQRFLFNSRKTAAPGENDFVSYSIFDPRQKAWIDAVDGEGDGSIDFRFVDREGQVRRTEYSVDQQWLELVQRGTLKGVVLDGEFMTPAAAREKLSARKAGTAK